MCANSSTQAATGRIRAAARTVGATRRPLLAGKPCSSADGRHSWGQALQKAEQKKRWQQLLEHLPENIRQLWHALGGHEKGRMEDLWRLFEAYGGQTIRVPAAIPAERHHPLLRRLGKRCAGKLVAAFGGTPVYVPRCTSVLTKLRQQEIIETFSWHTARGTSSTAAVASLARRHGISDRQVWKILKKTTSAPSQGYLLQELRDIGPHKENQLNYL
ncbi:MAG: Mor transcription activator family protein [Desulfovibrio sp.]|uniref:Mor transcription activator family protein n=1 Tax=Desulfovibrio sp. TaxID=885 RepID=UPI0039E42B40